MNIVDYYKYKKLSLKCNNLREELSEENRELLDELQESIEDILK